MLREWYMHRNDRFPRTEWAFGDVNPPVHVGGMARLQDRQEAQGKGRPRISAARLPQADAQLHLVGKPQRRRWA